MPFIYVSANILCNTNVVNVLLYSMEQYFLVRFTNYYSECVCVCVCVCVRACARVRACVRARAHAFVHFFFAFDF
jgi:hypothetical protein